jgi:hypothetical protein
LFSLKIKIKHKASLGAAAFKKKREKAALEIPWALRRLKKKGKSRFKKWQKKAQKIVEITPVVPPDALYEPFFARYRHFVDF